MVWPTQYSSIRSLSTRLTTERIAKIYNGNKNWDSGLQPNRIGRKTEIDSIFEIYLLLYRNGPLYSYYYHEGGAHLVVVTGVDVERGIVYTNNPQNARGIQTFEEFSTGYVDSFGNTIHGMNFGGIYVPKCSSLNR